jgi:hypothetical protein
LSGPMITRKTSSEIPIRSVDNLTGSMLPHDMNRVVTLVHALRFATSFGYGNGPMTLRFDLHVISFRINLIFVPKLLWYPYPPSLLS